MNICANRKRKLLHESILKMRTSWFRKERQQKFTGKLQTFYPRDDSRISLTYSQNSSIFRSMLFLLFYSWWLFVFMHAKLKLFSREQTCYQNKVSLNFKYISIRNVRGELVSVNIMEQEEIFLPMMTFFRKGFCSFCGGRRLRKALYIRDAFLSIDQLGILQYKEQTK